jgi:hypothetical protein
VERLVRSLCPKSSPATKWTNKNNFKLNTQFLAGGEGGGQRQQQQDEEEQE